MGICLKTRALGSQKPEAQLVPPCRGQAKLILYAHRIARLFALQTEAQSGPSLHFMEKGHGKEKKGAHTMEKHKYLWVDA